MKRLISLIVFVLPLLCGAFDFNQGGVRNAALGGTGISSSKDASATVWNPSYLSRLHQTSLLMDIRHSSIQLDNDDIQESFVYAGFPTKKWGTIGIGIGGFSSNDFSEMKMGAQYANLLLQNRLMYGVGLNIFNVSAPEVDVSKTTADLDLGFGYQLNNIFNLGLSLRNLLGSDLGQDSESKISKFYGFGMTGEFGRFRLMGDIAYEAEIENWMNFGFGGEFDLAKNFILRAGRSNTLWTAGFGLQFYGRHVLLNFDKSMETDSDVNSFVMSLDYSVTIPTGGESSDDSSNMSNSLKSEYGDHFIGIKIEWGNSKAGKERLVELFPSQFANFNATADTIIIETVKIDTVVRRVTVRDTVRIIEKEVDEATMRRIIVRDYDDMRRKDIKSMNIATTYLTESLKYFYKGEYQKAILQCTNAIQVAPDLALGYLRLGSIYFKLGNTDEAHYYWETAREKDPNNLEIKNFLENKDKDAASDEYLQEY